MSNLKRVNYVIAGSWLMTYEEVARKYSKIWENNIDMPIIYGKYFYIHANLT